MLEFHLIAHRKLQNCVLKSAIFTSYNASNLKQICAWKKTRLTWSLWWTDTWLHVFFLFLGTRSFFFELTSYGLLWYSICDNLWAWIINPESYIILVTKVFHLWQVKVWFYVRKARMRSQQTWLLPVFWHSYTSPAILFVYFKVVASLLSCHYPVCL